MSGDEQQELKSLLGKYQGVFQDQPGSTTLAEHPIETNDARPVRLPLYRLPQVYRETVQAELQDMLFHGIIEPSTSD